MAQAHTLSSIRRAWWLYASVLAVVAAAAAFSRPQPADLPVALPVILVATAGVGAIAAIVAAQRSLLRLEPLSDADAINELRDRQSLQVAIAVAPVLLGAGLAVAFGHRASLLTAVAAGAAALLVGLPRRTALEHLDATWQARGHDASILRGLGSE